VALTLRPCSRLRRWSFRASSSGTPRMVSCFSMHACYPIHACMRHEAWDMGSVRRVGCYEKRAGASSPRQVEGGTPKEPTARQGEVGVAGEAEIHGQSREVGPGLLQAFERGAEHSQGERGWMSRLPGGKRGTSGRPKRRSGSEGGPGTSLHRNAPRAIDAVPPRLLSPFCPSLVHGGAASEPPLSPLRREARRSPHRWSRVRPFCASRNSLRWAR